MVGSNFYNTSGFCNQEKVFDITNFVISNIQVLLWQDGNFKDINNNSLAGQNITFSNFYLNLGYDHSEFTTSDRKIFLYTPDGLQYNGSYRTKHIYVRFAQVSADKSDLDILNQQMISNTDRYYLYWEYYNPNLPGISEYSNLNSYVLLTSRIRGVQTNTDEVTNEERFNPANATVLLANARNRQMCSYVFTIYDTQEKVYITSPAMNFINQLYLPGAEIIDLLMGFQIEAALEKSANDGNDDNSYNGKYFIYGQDSKSMDKNITSRDHYLILSYTPTTDSGSTPGFKAGDTIIWKYSTDETMLDILNPNTLNSQISIDDKTEGQITYTMNIVDSLLTVDKRVQIPYRIKDYYSNAYIKNAITCTFQRDGEDIDTKSIDILFGTSGSQGNEYNLNFQLIKGEELVNAINLQDSEAIPYKLQATLYNYNNKKITDLSKYRFVWSLEFESNSNTNNIISFSNEENYSSVQIIIKAAVQGTLNLQDEINNARPGIIRCKVFPGEIEDTKEILEGIYPLTYTIGNVNSINNTTVITYDITGKKPVYAKNPLEVDIKSTNTVWNWSIEGNSTENDQSNDVWKPQILNGNEFVVPSIYHTESNKIKYSLVCTSVRQINGTTITAVEWKQTIYMQQDKYPLGTQNPERLPTEIVLTKQQNGQTMQTVVAKVDTTLVGRLKQDGTNTSGIVMGILDFNTQGLEENKKLGLYAYHSGTEFLRIDEDGYIYLNGGTDDDAETGGVNITESYIENSTLNNSILTDTTIKGNNYIDFGESNNALYYLNYKDENNQDNNILTINSDGTISITEQITGTITTAVYAQSAQSANTYSDTNSVIYRNFAAIKTALDSFMNPLGLTTSPYTIITE